MMQFGTAQQGVVPGFLFFKNKFGIKKNIPAIRFEPTI